MDQAVFIGNEDVRSALSGMISHGRIPQAVMLYENDGCGAMAIALEFLDNLYGHDQKVFKLIHPDIHFIFPIANGTYVKEKTENLTSDKYAKWWRELIVDNPWFTENDLSTSLGIEGKNSGINVADANAILSALSLTSFSGGYKSVVVYLPEKMNDSSANRLLKVVEEPPEKTLFIFITHAPERVIPTISSRCQGIRIIPNSKKEIVRILTDCFSKDPLEAAQAADMAGGSVGTALEYLSEKNGYSGWTDLFGDMMNALISKDLGSLLECSETMSSMDSREKQKAFCKFAESGFRKIFLVQQGMGDIADIAPEEKEFFSSVAGAVGKSFPRKASAAFDRAGMLLGRNVNQKVLFCDLACKLFAMV